MFTCYDDELLLPPSGQSENQDDALRWWNNGNGMMGSGGKYTSILIIHCTIDKIAVYANLQSINTGLD